MAPTVGEATAEVLYTFDESAPADPLALANLIQGKLATILQVGPRFQSYPPPPPQTTFPISLIPRTRHVNALLSSRPPNISDLFEFLFNARIRLRRDTSLMKVITEIPANSRFLRSIRACWLMSCRYAVVSLTMSLVIKPMLRGTYSVASFFRLTS